MSVSALQDVSNRPRSLVGNAPILKTLRYRRPRIQHRKGIRIFPLRIITEKSIQIRILVIRSADVQYLVKEDTTNLPRVQRVPQINICFDLRDPVGYLSRTKTGFESLLTLT
jgi:hypothetical protein